MIYYFFLYFLAGVVSDFLYTLNIRFVSRGKVLWSAIVAFLQTIVALLVIYDIVGRLDSQRSIMAIIIYALGVGVGTFLAMKFKLGKEDKN